MRCHTTCLVGSLALFLIACLPSGLPSCLAQEAADRRPNIVVIMADDLGFENLSCYGSEVYKTPHLDRLAAQGMRFLHGHAQPICTPSRVQIMTGVYNNKNYLRFGILDPEATTFAQVLRKAGYVTCVAGKWQLKNGYAGVKRFGFDRHCLWQLNRRPSRYPNPGLEVDGVRRDFKQGEFGPDVCVDYICEFIRGQSKVRERPFLVYYPMILPHWPFVPTPGSEDWDPKMWRDAVNEPGGYREQKYWRGMVEHTDKMVGRIMRQLDELGLREETLVVFTGDNGTYRGVTSRFGGREYRGGKGTTKDAGTHVPFLVSQPGTVPVGRVVEDLVDLSDVFPTLLEAAGVEGVEGLGLDGVSLVPVFQGKRRVKPFIYCWYQRNGVRNKARQFVRDQRFKLYADGKMYDVQADPEEAAPLGGERHEARRVRMQAALDGHLAVTRSVRGHIKARKAATKGIE